MRRIIVLLLVAACGRDSEKPASDPPPASAASAHSDVDALVQSWKSWRIQMASNASIFNADCGSHLTRLVAMAPLADELRTRLASLSAVDRARFTEQRKAIDAALYTAPRDPALADVRPADVERNEAEIHRKCWADPQFRQAAERAGVFETLDP